MLGCWPHLDKLYLTLGMMLGQWLRTQRGPHVNIKLWAGLHAPIVALETNDSEGVIRYSVYFIWIMKVAVPIMLK